jgi:hypothetical protein
MVCELITRVLARELKGVKRNVGEDSLYEQSLLAIKGLEGLKVNVDEGFALAILVFITRLMATTTASTAMRALLARIAVLLSVGRLPIEEVVALLLCRPFSIPCLARLQLRFGWRIISSVAIIPAVRLRFW